MASTPSTKQQEGTSKPRTQEGNFGSQGNVTGQGGFGGHGPHGNQGHTSGQGQQSGQGHQQGESQGSHNMADKAQEMLSTAAEKAGQLRTALGERADQATTTVGGGMQSLAGTIREKAPQGGPVGAAASRIADAFETSGRYLQEEGIQDMAADFTNLIRRNPIPALLVGVGLGFLMARATSRS